MDEGLVPVQVFQATHLLQESERDDFLCHIHPEPLYQYADV
jgi:hypothetical protein